MAHANSKYPIRITPVKDQSISQKANMLFKTVQKTNPQYMMYSQPQYYRSFLSTHGTRRNHEMNFKSVTPFTNSSGSKKRSLKELLKLLYSNKELCEKIKEQAKAQGSEEYEELEELLAGLKERAANLMPLVHNRNKSIPITSMSVKLMQPLSLNKGKHVHTSPLDSTLTVEKLKTAYEKYRNTSMAQSLFDTNKNTGKVLKSSTKDRKLIENKNLLASATSCEQRELYLGRTLYYEESLKKEIEELLEILQQNYLKYQIKEKLIRKTKGPAALIFSYVAKKRLNSINSSTQEKNRKKSFVDLESKEMDRRLVKENITAEDLLSDSKNVDVKTLAQRFGIKLDESMEEESFTLPSYVASTNLSTPATASNLLSPKLFNKKKKKKNTEKQALPPNPPPKEWSIKSLLFNNESHRLFGKEQKFIKRNTFSLIRTKNEH